MAQLSKADLYRLLAAQGYTGALAHIMAAGAWQESARKTDERGDQRADGFYCSRGIFQMNLCGGLGQGHPEELLDDPAYQIQHMGPVYRREYERWREAGYIDADLCSIVCGFAERPWDYKNPQSEARRGYRAAWYREGPDEAPPEGGSMARTYPFSRNAQYGRTHWDGKLALDVFDKAGAPILACADGSAEVHDYPLGGHTVTLYASGPGEEGDQVYYHAHLQQGTGVGGNVQRGQVIGRVGNTGNAANTPPHCHWSAGTRNYGVDYNGAGNVNPAELLDAWQSAANEETGGDSQEGLVTLLGYLQGDVADALESASQGVNSIFWRLGHATSDIERADLLTESAGHVGALNAAINTLRTGGGTAAVEAAQAREAQGLPEDPGEYKGNAQTEERPELEGPEAREARKKEMQAEGKPESRQAQQQRPESQSDPEEGHEEPPKGPGGATAYPPSDDPDAAQGKPGNEEQTRVAHRGGSAPQRRRTPSGGVTER